MPILIFQQTTYLHEDTILSDSFQVFYAKNRPFEPILSVPKSEGHGTFYIPAGKKIYNRPLHWT